MLSRRLVLFMLPFLLSAGFVLQSCTSAGAPGGPGAPAGPVIPNPAPVTPPRPPKTSLEPGRMATWRLWADDTPFVFAGRAGEVITVRVNSKSPGLDPHVRLVDPEGKVEALDDDSGGHGNCLIANHTLKRTGQYTVLVGSDGNVRGEVEILLEKAKSEP